MKKAFFKYIFALLLFGSNGIVASQISLTSYEIVFLRTLIGSAVLIVLFILTRQNMGFHKNKKHLFYLSVAGIAMGACWLFLFEAYQQLGIGIASVLYYCGPVIVMALSPIVFKEKLTRNKLIGFTIVLSGMLFINIDAFHQGTSDWGLFCGGMTALMYALLVIMSKKATKITGLESSMIQLFFSFLTVTLFIAFKQGFNIQISSNDIFPILVLGVLNTGIGCYLYFSTIKHLPVQTVSICGYLEPLSAVCMATLFLYEVMQPFQILGAVMILLGAAYGECSSIIKSASFKNRSIS